MIEKIVYDFLNKELGYPAYMEFNDSMPDTFVVIEKIGSSEDDHLETSGVAIQSYAPSLYETAKLNQKVKETMEKIVSLPHVAACNLVSDHNYTDTYNKRYRYQAIFDIVHY